jgi:hypothetical protein
MCTGRSKFLREHRDARERRVADRVGRMRRERETGERIAAPCIARSQSLAQVVLGVRRIGRRKLDRDDACHRAHADFAHSPQRRVGVVVHVRTAGRTRTQHLDGREPSAVVHELGRYQRLFERPDALLQPLHQREVVADSAEQRHGRVGVQVDEPGRQDMRRQRHAFARCIAC